MANGGIIGPVVTPPNVQTQSAPGVWTLQEAQEYIRQGLWPRRYDPLYNYTTLLLSGNGANNATNNSFLDSSSNNFTITRNGNTTQGTFSPFSQTGWGNYFDGTGDYLSVADNSVLRLGTSNFTIECWVNRAANGTAHSILAKGGASTGWLLEVTSGNVLQFTHTTTTITTSLPVYAGNWVHVAAVREGTGSNQFKLYINGTLAQTATMATDFTQTDTLYIGANRSAATTMNGYISNVRIVNGTALYTAQFTPSTTPLTTTSQGATAAQVELLTCQSNRFLDNSGNGFTVTPAGNSAVVAFSPFNATRPWDPLTYGGGGYFDGSGDYLTAPNNTAFDFGSGNWTVETWVYPASLASTLAVTSKRTSSNSDYRWIVAVINTNGTINTQITTTGSSWAINADTTSTVSAGQWSHIAWVRSGSDVSVYVNGVKNTLSSGFSGSLYVSTEDLNVGAAGTTGSFNYPMNGYMSNFRIVKGTAVYTSAFTPPTAPLTNITNTSLLLNFTNGGVFDATSKNALETVGNAQISTAQSQFGGSSIAFDGSGDYLLTNVASSDLYAFGSGDWTIECWVYFNNLTGDGIIYDGKLADGAYPTIYRSTSTIIYYTNGANRITSGTISATTWYHVAVSRSGTSVKLFINGVQAGSTYTDSQTYLCPANRPVIGAAGSSGFVGAASLNGYLQDLRVTKGVARYTANFAVPDSAFPTLGSTPPSVDPYFDYTTLLLPGSGSNNATNNSFLDSSANNFTITRNGNTTQGTFSPFSQTGWGNYFNGSTDWLTTGSSVAALGSGNWTVEFWIYPTTSGTDRVISDARTSSQGLQPTFYLNSANNIVFYTNATNVLTSSSTVSANVWTHIAFVKNSSTTTCYINGTARGTYSDSNTYLGNVTTFGASGLTADSHSAKLTGYISNYRSVVGRAVYTSAFDPPTTPLTRTTGGTNPPQGTETSLLICQSNRFLDSNGPNTPASSPITITPSGSPSVQAFSPFNPSASWSAATYGGSGYFDGSGDYLSIARNSAFTPTGDFTYEIWVYPTATPDATHGAWLGGLGESGDGTQFSWTLKILSNLTINLYIRSTNVDQISTETIKLNQWNYIAVTRQGSGSNNLLMVVNGVSKTFTDTGSLVGNGTPQFTIGADTNGDEALLTGYVSGVRLLNGTGYTSISVPTSPPTAITNTSLLLNYTNAGIYDATSKNDLETVGDAKISTAQSVWTAYGASMYFDGTGDYLSIPSSVNLNYGSGSFTFEGWLYVSSYPSWGSIGTIISNRANAASVTGNIFLAVTNQTSSNKIKIWASSGAGHDIFNEVDVATGLSTNTWFHFAVVRSGNTWYGFVNGSQTWTTTSSSTLSANALATTIGADTNGNGFTGYMQDVRITKGYARYTSAFQPPSAPLALR